MGNITFFYDEIYKDNSLGEHNSRACYLINDQGVSSTVLKGILDEDSLNITLRNEFNKASSNSSGIAHTLIDGLNKLKPSLYGATATLLSKLTTDSNQASTPNDEEVNSNTSTILDKIKSTISDTNNWLHEVFNDVKKAAANNIEIYDDYLYLFEGSGINVPLTIHSRLLTEDENETETVIDKLEKILNVSIGDYESVLDGVLGIQAPPNGYIPSYDGIKGAYAGKSSNEGFGSTSLQGTFTLRIGDKRIPGCVIEEVNINESTTKCKVKNKSVPVPLYIDLTITLKCLIKIDKKLLMKLFNINYNK